jgi:hypothetical protein
VRLQGAGFSYDSRDNNGSLDTAPRAGRAPTRTEEVLRFGKRIPELNDCVASLSLWLTSARRSVVPRYDSFSFAVTESLACALLVVSNSKGTAELSRSIRGALIAEVHPEQIAETMQSWLFNEKYFFGRLPLDQPYPDIGLHRHWKYFHVSEKYR